VVNSGRAEESKESHLPLKLHNNCNTKFNLACSYDYTVLIIDNCTPLLRYKHMV
jgi:hypothetical protein